MSHTVYCYRNNYRCTVCDEVIPLREKEEHIRHWTDGSRLLAAVSGRELQTVQAMVAHGADLALAISPETRETAMHHAARMADMELIIYCVSCGVDIDTVNIQGQTPLHLAVETGDFSVVKLLIEVGAGLNVANGQGETSLLLATRKGDAQVVQYLVENRADTEASTKLGDTPVQLAQSLGNREVVMALCMHGASLRSGTPQRHRSTSKGRRLRSSSPSTSSRRSRGEDGQCSRRSRPDDAGHAAGGYPSGQAMPGAPPPLPRRAAQSPAGVRAGR